MLGVQGSCVQRAEQWGQWSSCNIGKGAVGVFVRVSAMGYYWTVRGQLDQTADSGRQRSHSFSRENTWSSEHYGHVCLNTLWEDANDTEYRGLQINLGCGRWGFIYAF